MPSYMTAFVKAQGELIEAKRSLSEVLKERDSYSDFLNEAGQMSEYMKWWAEKEGFSQVTKDRLRLALDQCQQTPGA